MLNNSLSGIPVCKKYFQKLQLLLITRLEPRNLKLSKIEIILTDMILYLFSVAFIPILCKFYKVLKRYGQYRL